MRIAIYGATGMIGSRVAAEAVSRGHHVTGISRSGGVGLTQGDAGSADFTRSVSADHEVVVSAIGPSRTTPDAGEFRASVANLVTTLGHARLVVAGGAGTLEVEGVRLVDDPQFPAAYRSEALKQGEVLDDLRALGSTNWTYLSPAPEIAPGDRTGVFALGADSPVGGKVSAEDYAVALVDEIEHPAHAGRRFTVAN